MCFSKPQKPKYFFEPRPFISQGKVSYDVPDSIVYERKFDTAIRGSHITNHNERVDRNLLTLDDKLIMNCQNYPEHRVNLDESSKALAYLMRERYETIHLNDRLRLQDRNQPKRVSRIIDIVHSNLKFQCEYLNQSNSLPSVTVSRSNLKKMFKKCSTDISYIAGLVDLSDWLLGVINKSNLMYAKYYQNLNEDLYIDELSKFNQAKYDPNGLELSWSHNYCIFKMGNRSMLLPKVYILLLHNKICDLLSILIYTRYAQHSTLPKEAYITVLDFCHTLWTLHIEYGQKFFTIAKCLEGLATAESLADVEQWNNTDFLNTIIKDIRLDTGFDYKSSDLRKMLRKADIPFRHELAALSKISGHPFVDMQEGSYSLHKYTTESYNLNQDKIFQCICYIKQNYIRNHILRDNKWPPIKEIPIEAPAALRHAFLRNKDPEGAHIKAKYGSIKVEDYEYITLDRNLNYLKLENAIPYLKDKTVSILRTDVIRKYINQEENISATWKDTRLLLYYLMHSGEETNHVDFLNRYSDADDFEDFLNYLVIRVVPKEKELKVAFRGFGCTTFHNRMLFLTQEKTAMHYLDLYSDEQAMTLSELDLVKRLYTFRNLKKAYPRHRIVYAMIDASKWNNHFRPETVDYVMAQTLDPIHGTSIFGKTQKKFENSFIYVPDQNITYHWNGQSGGIEGLNQDTWVITYIAQIKTALAGLDLKFHILCKGDDLRLAIIIPEEDPRSGDIKATKDNIMVRLSEAAKDVGHDIKIYDSYGSECYFNFSKSASVYNIELPQVFRKIQKCYGASNAFLPTFDEFIGSTFSNAHSACRVTTNFVPCYAVALFWTFYYLTSDKPMDSKTLKSQRVDVEDHHTRFMSYSDLSDAELVALSLVPSLLGGFPIIYLHNVMVRSETDLLTPFIHIYMYAKQHRYSEYTKVFKNFLRLPKEKHETFKPLYKDVYCLPIKKPQSPSQYLRNQIVPSLKKITKAEDIKELLQAAEDDDVSQRYIKAMDRSEIVHAKIFSVVYSAFPEAVLEEFILKFESARSVLELLILRCRKGRALTILKKIVVLERGVNQWRLQRLKGLIEYDIHDYTKYITQCPTESAQKIRDVAWGKPIDGITMPSMSHLLLFTTPFISSSHDHCRENHFVYNFELPTDFPVTYLENHHYGKGSYAPFIGHVTGTGTLNPTLHLVEKDAILTKLRNIAELVSWTDVEETLPNGDVRRSNLRDLVEGVVSMYTDQKLSDLAPFLGSRKSGTIAHHIRLRHFREAVMPNSLSNVYQYCVGESNTHTRFFGDQGHYWVNFLQCHSHAVCMSAFELNSSPIMTVPKEVWAVTVDCDYCMREVYEPAVVVDTSCIKGSKFPSLLATRMSTQAKMVLKSSLCMAKGRKYNLTGNEVQLSIEVATTGIFQMLCETSVSTSQRLIDRYTQHVPTREGYSVLKSFFVASSHRVIGHRELSNMDDQTLTACVVYTVVGLMSEQFVLKSLGDLELAMKTFPAYALPWYTLLHELYKVGRLGILVENIAKIAGTLPAGILFTPDAAAPFVGVLCYKALANWQGDIPLVILSNYEINDIYMLIVRQKFKVLWIEAATTMRIRLNAIQNEQSKLILISAYIILLSVSYQMIPEATKEDFDLTTENNQMRLITLMEPDLSFIDDINDKFPEDEDLYPAWLETSIDKLRKMLGIYAKLLSKITPFKIQDIYNTIINNLDEVRDRTYETYNTIIVRFTYTTAEQCIERIRHSPSIFSRYSIEQTPTDDQWMPMVNYFESRIPSAPDPVMRCPRLDMNIGSIEQNPNFDFEFSFSTIARSNRTICPFYLNRVYGHSNDTMNKLAFIFDYLKHNKEKPYERLSISVLGDGIGNGTYFLAHLHPSSHFVFTTKPPNQLYHVQPSVAEHVLEVKSCTFSSDHNLQGCWDLKTDYTINYLTSKFGSQHIYFCDAEPEPEEQTFYILRRNIVDYYLSTRYKTSVLIIQCAISEPLELARMIVKLKTHCTDVYLLQPPSERCVFGCYLVAWGYETAYTEFPFEHISIPATLVMALKRFITNAYKRYASNRVDRPLFVKLEMPSTNIRYPIWNRILPPLWTSYLKKEYNIHVTHDQIEELITIHDLETLQLKNPLNRAYGYSLLAILTSKEDNKIYRDQVYDMNHRAHRLHITYLYMKWLGWTSMYKRFFVRYEPRVNIKKFREDYLSGAERLPKRDWTPENHINRYSNSAYERNTHYPLQHWKNFCNGAEICLSYIAWIRATHPRLSFYVRTLND